MVGIGVIGAGVMGTSHVRTLAGLGGARVVAVSDPDQARAERSAAQAGARVIVDPGALITDPEVRAVLIVSPDEMHREQVLKALAANKPVLCEKPLAPTVAETHDILKADAGRDLVQVGFMRRFDPAYADFRAHLESGEIGTLLTMRMGHHNAHVPPFMTGAQGMTNSLVHEFDILRWLTNDEVVRIRTITPKAAGGPALIDPMLVMLETKAGVLVEVELLLNSRYGYAIHTRAVGTEGLIEMAVPQATRRLTAAGDVMAHAPDFVVRFGEAYRLELADWIAALNAGKSKGRGSSARDGAIAIAIAEAGLRALETGDWVEVPEIAA